MISPVRFLRIRVLVAFLAAFAIFAPAGAIRFDGTEEEIHCAQTLGVNVAGDAHPGLTG